MLLLVVRSCVVYGATAALLLWLANRFVLPIRRRVAVLLALAPLLFTGKALLTGGVYAPIDIVYRSEPFSSLPQAAQLGLPRTPLLSDVVYSMIPWQQALRAAVRQGRLPLWNPAVMAGEPLLAVQQAAPLHPGTWIGFLLPLAQAWTFQMSLRLLLALVAAYLFCRDLGCGDAAALVGAVGWAFSDFLVFWLGYSVGASVAPFPLLALGLSRLVRDANSPAAGLTVAALVLIVTAGHPETLLFAVVGAGLYFLFLLAGAERGRRSRPIRLSLIAGAIALGLTATQLWTMAEVLPGTAEHVMRVSWYSHLQKSVTPSESLRRLWPNLVPAARLGPGGRDRWAETPACYAGSILLPLALVGLFSRRRQRWGLLLVAAAGIALWVRLRGVADLAGAVPLLDIAVLDYFVFLAVFGVAMLAAIGAERLRDGEGRPAFIVGALLTIALLAAVSVRERSENEGRGLASADWRPSLAGQIAPVAVALVAMGALSRRHRAIAGAPLLVVVLAASRIAEAGGVYPTAPASAFFPPLPVLDAVPRGQPYRVVGLDYAFIPNVAALYGLEDVRGYSSMTLRRYLLTWPLWCESQGIWFNRVDDPTRPFLSFLNVRWVIAPAGAGVPDGWPVLAEGSGVRVLENPRALPRAFVPRLVRAEPDLARGIELLKSIDDFAERGLVETGESPGTWVANGDARVTIASYAPQAMELGVDAARDTLVATSMVGWPGWKARVDGRRAAPVPYNLAFLSFRVPAGRHRLSIAYEPDGFRYGAVASAMTLLLAAAWLVVSRRT